MVVETTIHGKRWEVTIGDFLDEFEIVLQRVSLIFAPFNDYTGAGELYANGGRVWDRRRVLGKIVNFSLLFGGSPGQTSYQRLVHMMNGLQVQRPAKAGKEIEKGAVSRWLRPGESLVKRKEHVWVEKPEQLNPYLEWPFGNEQTIREEPIYPDQIGWERDESYDENTLSKVVDAVCNHWTFSEESLADLLVRVVFRPANFTGVIPVNKWPDRTWVTCRMATRCVELDLAKTKHVSLRLAREALAAEAWGRTGQEVPVELTTLLL